MVLIDKKQKHTEEDYEGKSGGRPLISIMNSGIKTKRNIRQLPILVAMLGPGELFGDFESYNNVAKHEFTLECRSLKGEVLLLDKAEFTKKIGVMPEAVKKVI